MPRTIDKIRATLPGGHLGPYNIAPGISQMLLTIIGVQLAELRSAVMMAEGDFAIAAWLQKHADTSRYPHANKTLTEFRHENIALEHRANFESLYPEYLLKHYPVAFDLIEADDRELYPTLVPNSEAL